MAFGILNIIFGALVVSPSFVAHDKRSKYTNVLSWAGIILLIWGIMGTVSSLLYIQTLETSPLYWVLWLAGGLAGLVSGILLLYNLIKKSPDKILPYLRIAGIVTIVIGITQLFVGE
jgi:drug/metabolite transporter (DMT)-like permease